jgi:Fe-S cluster biogenesis protein NfuA
MSSGERWMQVCEEVLAPLVQADGGELWLVAADADRISLHLAGTCAGCPGAGLTTREIIEPALRAVLPSVRVTVTSGIVVPEGARRVVASMRLSSAPGPGDATA